MRCTLQKYQQFSPKLLSSVLPSMIEFSVQGLSLVSDVMPFCAAAKHRDYIRDRTSWHS
jgi:hypothetical protein